ncbi:MAG: G5 domain-containing protein [Clostridia bacterium]|nr:G5 domain-containing protein [Clostridia bacterium]
MKFHDNSFGRRERKTVFLSFLAAATALQLTSCADNAQIPELPPAEQTYVSQSEFFDLIASETTASSQTTQTQTAQTTVPSPVVPDTAVTEETSKTEAETEKVVSVRTEITEEIVTEAFQTRYEYSADHEKGTHVQKQKGVDGKIKVTTVTTYENDTVTDVSQTREILTERVDAVVLIGMKIVRTEKMENQTTNVIPFETVYTYDDTRYEDERNVVTTGKNGYTLQTYLITYENNKEISRKLISSSVFAPVNEVIRIGTKPIVTEKTETVKENPVAYTTRYEYDETLDYGLKKLKTAGVNGYTEKTYQITYYKGNESSREIISEKTVAPVEEVIIIGTKKEETYYMPFRDAAHGGYNYPVTQSFSSSHRALDFGVWYGEPICAIKSGTVIAAYNEGYFSTDNILWTYGTYVVIEHDDGMRSYYAHLKSKTVSVGQRVSGGQVIGYSGNTGRVNPAPTASDPLAGTHLHFEIRIKQGSSYVTVDPRKYLPYWN